MPIEKHVRARTMQPRIYLGGAIHLCSCQAVSLISVAGGGYTLIELFCLYGVKVAPTAVASRVQVRSVFPVEVGGGKSRKGRREAHTVARATRPFSLPAARPETAAQLTGACMFLSFWPCLAVFGARSA